MIKVKKIKNIHDLPIEIQIGENTKMWAGPGFQMENVTVYNLDEIKGMVEVTHDLTEVQPIQESKVKLFD